MTQIVSVSVPDGMYQEILIARKDDPSTFSWSNIFRVGFMRVSSNKLGDIEEREETKEKITKLVEKLDYYSRRTQELEMKIYKLGDKP